MKQLKANPVRNPKESKYFATFNIYLAKVFLWLASGLTISLVISFRLSAHVEIFSVLSEFLIGISLAATTFLFAFFIGGKLSHLPKGIATATFLLYSFFNSLTLTSFSVAYDLFCLKIAFLALCILYFLMSAYAWFADTEVSSFEIFLAMIVFGFLICSGLYYFLGEGNIDYILPLLTCFIFAGISSYDIHIIRELFFKYGHSEYESNAAMLSALKMLDSPKWYGEKH